MSRIWYSLLKMTRENKQCRLWQILLKIKLNFTRVVSGVILWNRVKNLFFIDHWIKRSRENKQWRLCQLLLKIKTSANSSLEWSWKVLTTYDQDQAKFYKSNIKSDFVELCPESDLHYYKCLERMSNADSDKYCSRSS